jgi:hypothetical protein
VLYAGLSALQRTPFRALQRTPFRALQRTPFQRPTEAPQRLHRGHPPSQSYTCTEAPQGTPFQQRAFHRGSTETLQRLRLHRNCTKAKAEAEAPQKLYRGSSTEATEPGQARQASAAAGQASAAALQRGSTEAAGSPLHSTRPGYTGFSSSAPQKLHRGSTEFHRVPQRLISPKALLRSAGSHRIHSTEAPQRYHRGRRLHRTRLATPGHRTEPGPTSAGWLH